MATKKPETGSFETQLEALEMIVQGLETGDLTLEESLSQFEKGVVLTKECQSILNTAEQKVSMLTNGSLAEANLNDE
ncbi:MAG: exodeoxyribonuclease VII small subunit [Gammaproteobacteria bacterium]|nr:MAG: exodeoxyribonuclease VII small subunit [Gammaproteobacteria bacterium]